MTTDNPTEAARAYAEQACYQDENRPIAEAGFRAGWKAASTHLAAQNEAAIRALATTTAHTGQDIAEAARIVRDVAQEPTDAEVIAALGAANRTTLTGQRFDAPLSFYADNVVEAMRAALSSARAARRDEEAR